MKRTTKIVTFLTLLALPCAAVRGDAAIGDVRQAASPDPVADPKAVVVAGKARFTVLTAGLIRMEWSPDGEFEDRASQVVVNRRLPVPDFEQSLDADTLTLRTQRIELHYDSAAGRFDPSNLKLRGLVGPGEEWIALRPPFAQESNLGGTTRTLDGVSGACPLEPGLLSREGWTLLDDSATLVLDDGGARRDLRTSGASVDDWPWATPRKVEGAIDWYLFVYGSDYKTALADYTKIAGPIPLPPRYVFGSWWSRYWAYTDRELKLLVSMFDQHAVPLDVLVIDMDWHLDGWTGYTWNPKYFPDPEGFLKWIKARGLRVTLNLHPAEGVGKHEAAFGDMCKALDLDPEKTERIAFDCTDRRYVDAYFKYLHHPLEKMGVDFWWMDWQQGTETNISGLDPLWWLNYLHWTDMEQRAGETGRRPLIFSRWGGLGNHRYQVGFSGDTFCDWASLAFQPYFTATAGNVGYAYWSHDIGGHQPGPVEPELYARWIQFGALSPILRTHTTKNPAAERRIWQFPSEVFDSARKAFYLRYELIPYIYTMARKCYDTALPLCRPLYYEWPDMEEAYTWKNQYLFGDDFLVAPVVEPGDTNSGCAMVEVWLPPGRWINWFTGRAYEGPRVVPQVVPLDEIPLFVRAGAIIPTIRGTRVRGMPGHGLEFPPAERPLETLVLNVFPANRGETRLYEDDGLSDGYLRGEHAWTRISQSWTGGKRLITIEPPVGRYPGMPRERSYVVRVFDVSPTIFEIEVNGVLLNATSGEAEADRTYWWYDAAIMGPSIHLPPRSIGSETLRIVIGESEVMRGVAAGLDGFRGMMSAFCQANRLSGDLLLGGSFDCDDRSWVFGLHQLGPEQEVEEWKVGIARSVTGIRAAMLTPEAERRALMRLLGLFCKLSVEPMKDDGGASAAGPQLRARLHLTSVQPLPLLENVWIDIRLRCDGDWRILQDEGGAADSKQSAWKVRGVSEDDPFVAEWRLSPEGEPNTAVLHSEIIVHDDDRALQIPLQTVLLPSINAWWVLGPFDAPFDEALDRVFPPERQIDLAASYKGKDASTIRWQQARRSIRPGDNLTDEFFMNFSEVFGGRVYEAVAYAYTHLESPDDMEATLAIGSDDGVVVWLNDEKVHHHHVGRPYSSKQDRVPVRLKKGVNKLLIKVNQGGGDWGLGVHVETSDGKPLTQVKARLPEE